MKKEARFLKECIGRYLGKQEELDLALVYKKCVPVKLFSLISDQRLEGLMHYLDSRECFINIPLPESIKTRWKTIAWKNSFQNDLTDTNADSIFRQMAVLGLEYVWLKGKAVRMLHKTDYIFSSSDLDLFIDKDTYPELKKLLLSEGYTIPEPEKMMKDTVLDISEFEESMNEIMFVKKDKAINYVIDVQWDFIGFGTKSPLHDLYGINELILSQRTKLDPGSSTYPMSLSTEIHFCVMAIHLCLHHGFRGVKWFVDMANYYLLCSPDLEKLNKEVSRDVMKSVGIEVALIHEYA
ncbi:MAG TPA: nucleotidyltransferase family protein, partial [Clostridia bacterium]|nr:nucleotidyltransferase family protein [Clostridia bacterium]